MLLGLALLAGCAPRPFDVTGRVALLGPFEGRYQEVGYNALYAARLAAQDAGLTQIELLVVDDGGTASSAAERARALHHDPLVKAVLLTGYAAAAPETQAALGDIPALIIGQWGAAPTTDRVFMLASQELGRLLTAPPRINVIEAATLTEDITGSEVFALAQFPLLSKHPESVTIVSNASLPDGDFTERYRSSGLFVPVPGLLATLTYDATFIAFTAATQEDRVTAHAFIANTDYPGLNGTIRFENGFWADAPLHFYRYDTNGRLLPVNRAVE
ncbi:MAG: hypothetical protein H6672_10805 [Anaerolineaceae bacterium]|nr:hypothetical protein [Anaerolineaceae bacterium]